VTNVRSWPIADTGLRWIDLAALSDRFRPKADIGLLALVRCACLVDRTQLS
jgi:hypothetical protein